METWFMIVVSLCVSALLKSLYNLFFPFYATNNKNKHQLPPGPPTFPIIGNFLWLRKSFSEIEPLLRQLRLKYGPLITLRIGSRPAIFVVTHSLSHRALVQNGAVFSDRPGSGVIGQVLNVSSASYGPTWRLLRRNLTSEILHPSRVRSYSRARRWVLGILIDRLLASQSESAVVDEFRYAMFCLLVLMCFGDKLEEKQIKEIETVQRRLLLSLERFNVLNFWPRLGKIVFRNRWKELKKLRQDQENVLIPLIKSRIKAAAKSQQENKARKENNQLERVDQENNITTPSCHDEAEEEEGDYVVAYVDTLMDLQLPDKKRKLNYGEMVSLCGEFLNAGTDTTSTALQWIMANLVKYPQIQAKLYEEITGAVGPPPSKKEWERKGSSNIEEGYPVLNEGDLQRMPYLKAVVLEGLRRHPPGHFVLPHSVTEDVELEGYVVPKNATVNFMVAEMGWDPKVWDDPMEFKPERFLSNTNGTGTGIGGHNKEEYGEGGGEAFDITGSREIKMMPFGAGRRICPGSGLALLHLEYFVANLIWYFEWKTVDGDDVDLSEKQEFTVVMKNPLRAHVAPRVKSSTAAT